MTAKTIHKRAKSKFDMKAIRKRTVKMFRKRYKKKIKLRKVDSVWADWVEFMIVRPLLKHGKVQVDKSLSFEIVGKRVIDNKRVYNLISKGKIIRPNGTIKNVSRLNKTRPGITYGIVMEDNLFKDGRLSFKADAKIRKRVTEQLENTNTYYRIQL